MGAYLTFVGTYLLSQFVALLAALQLADYFQASEEFVAVMLALIVFVSVAMAVFVMAYAIGRSASAIGWAAISLSVVAVAMVMGPSTIQRFAERSTNRYTVGLEGVYITAELLVPALIAILMQWGLVRRRLLRERGEDDLTLWPWVTFAVAGLAVLNPLGLSILGAAVAQYPTDWFRAFWRGGALAAAAVVVVMIAFECYIRGRMLRRRRGANGAIRG